MSEKFTRKTNVDIVQVEQVIVVHSILGRGVEGDPVRRIIEYYRMDGTLIVRIDTFKSEQEIK